MKINSKPSFYFSAYPLKVISGSSLQNNVQGSPYLKALLSEKTNTCSRVRVFPITNSYNNQFRPAPFDHDKLPKDIELTEKDWFNNYE
jgi:hypothetical protein